MNIYELKPIPDKIKEKWDPWYDKAFGFVIVADSSWNARLLASEECGYEGKEVWLNFKYTSCSVLDVKNEIRARIVVRDMAMGWQS